MHDIDHRALLYKFPIARLERLPSPSQPLNSNSSESNPTGTSTPPLSSKHDVQSTSKLSADVSNAGNAYNTPHKLARCGADGMEMEVVRLVLCW